MQILIEWPLQNEAKLSNPWTHHASSATPPLSMACTINIYNTFMIVSQTTEVCKGRCYGRDVLLFCSNLPPPASYFLEGRSPYIYCIKAPEADPLLRWRPHFNLHIIHSIAASAIYRVGIYTSSSQYLNNLHISLTLPLCILMIMLQNKL